MMIRNSLSSHGIGFLRRFCSFLHVTAKWGGAGLQVYRLSHTLIPATVTIRERKCEHLHLSLTLIGYLRKRNGQVFKRTRHICEENPWS